MRSTFVRPSAFTAASAAIILLALTGCTAQETESRGGEEAGATYPRIDGSDVDRTRDEYDLALAQCLRESGFDVEDPAPGQGIRESGPEIQAAAARCEDEIGAPPVMINGVNPQEILEGSLEFAACLRGRGYGAVDPKLGEVLVVPDAVTEEDLAACAQESNE